MRISMCARHRATFFREGCGIDRIAVDDKMSRILGRLRHREAITRICRDHTAVFRPVNEGISCMGRSRQSAIRSYRIDAGTSDRATICWLNGRGDVAAVSHEIGGIGLVS